MTPLAPFTFAAWAYIVIVVFYMAAAVSMVQKRGTPQFPETRRSEKMKKLFGSIGDNTFYGVTSFAKGEVTSESDEPSVSEKIVIAGFMLFALM